MKLIPFVYRPMLLEAGKILNILLI